jgi:thiol-disulfide isomerase/thioredoxin
MDRLYPVTSSFRASGRVFSFAVVLVLFTGCEESAPAAGEAPPARFQAVTAKTVVTSEELAGFCDVQNGGSFRLPELTAAAPAKAPDEPRWVNMWATWCKSCVEEMPMIETWRAKLAGDVLFVSADEDPEALQNFSKKHPDLPASLHMKDPEGLAEWMKGLSLDAGAGLPLHIFVGAEGNVRCIRAGAVSESHYAVVESLMK